MTRVCRGCNADLPTTERLIGRPRAYCDACANLRQVRSTRIYYQRHQEKRRAVARARYRARRLAYFRDYYAEHRERILARRAERLAGVPCKRCGIPRGESMEPGCVCGPRLRQGRPMVEPVEPLRYRVPPAVNPTDPFWRPAA